jgi:hypothetical protein
VLHSYATCEGECGTLMPPHTRVIRRRVGWFNFILADKYHRITELHPATTGGGVWTLFFAGPLARDGAGRPRGWGFWIPGRGHVDQVVRAAERTQCGRARDTAGEAGAAHTLTFMRLLDHRRN